MHRNGALIPGIANAILSDKHNRLLPGEKHQIIYLPDETYNPARYSGPGTNLKVRISRNDQPLSYVDKVAEAHDLRYALASVVSGDVTYLKCVYGVSCKLVPADAMPVGVYIWSVRLYVVRCR